MNSDYITKSIRPDYNNHIKCIYFIKKAICILFKLKKIINLFI